MALALLLPLAAAAADLADWELRAHSARHSDFGTIDATHAADFAHLHAREGRNIAYDDDEVRLQRVTADGWIALLARNTITLAANADAVDALRHVHKIGRDGTDRTWQVDAHLSGFTGAGVELGHRFQLSPQWSAALQAQGLVLSRWRDRHIEGSAAFQAATNTYSADLQSSQIDPKLKFPFEVERAHRGEALLFGGDLRWHRGPWTLEASARDLGWLHWKNIPQQELALDSNTQGVDANGFVVYQPLLQGRNSQQGLTRTAPPRWSASATWDATRDGQLTVATEHLQDFGLLPSMAWTQRAGPVQAQIGWRFHERRLELGLSWGGWRIAAGADRLRDTQSRMVLVSYTHPFP